MRRPGAASLLLAVLVACDGGHGVGVVTFHGDSLDTELARFAPLLDGARIVLLGENGHGVKEITQAKVELVEWLHRDHGFDLVVFESGMFECDLAWRRLQEATAARALRGCLRYPFEHAEALPLFEYMRASASSRRPLAFSGMDPQAQGYDSEERPRESFARLVGADADLAARVAAADSALFLIPEMGGLGDEVYRFAHVHRDSLTAEYRAAAAATSGVTRHVFSLAEGWVHRLAIRGAAEEEGVEGRPRRYYEVRDQWMARAVSALADSTGAGRKVVVWLHNDHARYGRFPSGGDSIRSTGGFLREWYGDGVVSVGFFLGRGEVADNARRPRTVVPWPEGGLEHHLAGTPGTYVVLRGNGNPAVRAWADRELPYLRAGLDTLTLTPSAEFDVLMYVDSVSVPTYGVR